MKKILFMFLLLVFGCSIAGAVSYNETFSDNFDDNTLDEIYVTGYNNVQGTVLEENGILNVSSGKTAAGSQWATFLQSGSYFQTDINVNNTNALFYSYLSFANHTDYTVVGDYQSKHLNNSYVVRVIDGKIELYSADGTATLTKRGELSSSNTLNSWTRLYVYYSNGKITIGTNKTASIFEYSDPNFVGFERVMLQSGEYASYWTISSYDNLVMGDVVYIPDITPGEETPISSYEYQEKTFSVTTDRTADISWYLNGTLLKTDEDTTSASYVNSSGVEGVYNLTVTATNENGTDSYEWLWTVENLPELEPEITYTPLTDPINYENIPQTFTIDITNTKGTFVWTLDDVPVESTDTEISSEYTLPAQEAGSYVLGCTVSNVAGSTGQSWNVTYLENSMTLDVIYFNATPATNGSLFIFNVSNFTDGVGAWSPQDFNATIEGNTYNWVYENNTVISSKTAISTGEALDFDSTAVPEGIYKIGVVPIAVFLGTPTSGTVNTSIVTFTDSSIYADTWAWDFENDGSIDNADQNPTHAYTIAGTYSVNLTASNDYGSDSELKTAYILVSPNEGIDPFNWFYWWMRSHWRW